MEHRNVKRTFLTLAKGLAAGMACLSLSACGFTPLYASPGVSPGMSAIAIEAPRGRAAYLLRESLDDALGHDASKPAAYRLKITVEERRFARGLRIDNVANRYELQVKVGYSLIDAQTRSVLMTGIAPVAVTYDSADAPYGGISAQQDGQKRAADEAAQQIRIDMARFFATRTAP